MAHRIIGLIGSKEKVKTYVDELKQCKDVPYILFVSDDMVPDNKSCYQYIKDFCNANNLFESEDTLLGLLEFAEIEEHFIHTCTDLPLGIKRRLILLQAFLMPDRSCLICGLFEKVHDTDAIILNNMLTELSTRNDIILSYSICPKNSLCDDFIYL